MVALTGVPLSGLRHRKRWLSFGAAPAEGETAHRLAEGRLRRARRLVGVIAAWNRSGIPPHQPDHVGHQALFVIPAARHMPLRRAVLAQHPAGTPLRDPEGPAHPLDAPPGSQVPLGRLRQDQLAQRQV